MNVANIIQWVSRGPEMIHTVSGETALQVLLRLSTVDLILTGLATAATLWPIIAWLLMACTRLSQGLAALHAMVLALLICAWLFSAFTRLRLPADKPLSDRGGKSAAPRKRKKLFRTIGDAQRYRRTMAIRLKPLQPPLGIIGRHKNP